MLETFFSPENPFIKILLSVGLGIFLGLRREIDFAEELRVAKKERNKENSSGFMGIRTMMLLSVLGVISTLITETPYGPVILFFPISILIAISHAYGSFSLHRAGLTTEFAALMMYWIGVLIGLDQTFIAVTLTIVLGGINGFKVQLRSLAGVITAKEWQSALQLLILSGVVLPFLPKEAIDPWGLFVPFNIWFLVILILTFEFLGYFLIKFYGERGGLPLTGFLGSIVSSTAVTTSLANRAKNSPHVRIFAGSILIALATMQFRVLIEILLLSPISFWQRFMLVPTTMAIVSLISGAWFIRMSKYEASEQKEIPLEVESPLEILPAMKFGLIFVVILAVLGIARYELGDSGVYVASFLSGMVDIDAIVLSTLEAFRLGTLEENITQNAIFVALIVNTLVKIPYVAILSNKKVTIAVTKATLISAFVGGLVLFLI